MNHRALVTSSIYLSLAISSRSQSVVTILPDRPKLGDTITFVYNPNAVGAKLRNKRLVSLILLPFARPSIHPAVTFAKSYDMELENGLWVKKLVWLDSTKPFFRFSFLSSIAESSEVHESDEFQFLLFDKYGMHLPNAHLCRYYALMNLQGRAADSMRYNELLEEVRSHPTNFRAHQVLWSNELKLSEYRPETRIAVRRTVDSVLQNYSENLDALVACTNAYTELGDTVKANQLEFRLLSLFPFSTDAEILKFRRAFKETVLSDKVASLSELLQVFPNSEIADRAFSLIEDYYKTKQDSTTPRMIRENWERARSRDPNMINPSLEQVRKIVQQGSKAQAPPFILFDLKGNRITRETLGHKIIVIDFWATWCKPCREAFPRLQRIYDRYRGSNRVAFIAVNVNTSGDSIATVQAFLSAYGYSLPVALDTSGVTDQFSITAIPTTILVDSRGNIRYRSTGYMNPDEYTATITTVIQTLLTN